MKKKRSKSRDEAKHEAILKAATQLFLKHGYSNTSMEAIAKEARVTKQTVYSHYHNKDALFKHMLDQLRKKHAPSEALLAEEGEAIEAVLTNLGQRFLNMLTSKEGLATTRLVIAEVQHHPELAHRYYADVTDKLIEMLGKYLDKQHKLSVLSIADAKSAAAQFFAMIRGRYYVRMLLGVKPMPTARERELHVVETVGHFMKLYGTS